MRVLCIWGETRADVLAGYRFVDQMEDKPQRVTWRLAAAFTGEPVGDECYAPDFPEIREAYGEDVPQVEEVAVHDDDSDLDE